MFSNHWLDGGLFASWGILQVVFRKTTLLWAGYNMQWTAKIIRLRSRLPQYFQHDRFSVLITGIIDCRPSLALKYWGHRLSGLFLTIV
jgi:hypothetical protein